jgi:hypothetical protein
MSVPTGVHADRVLDPQLADLISESLVWSGDAAGRAEVLTRIIECALDALAWRLEPDGDTDEEVSARRVLRAAEQHRDRMRPRADRR